jgi:hypothetical protein
MKVKLRETSFARSALILLALASVGCRRLNELKQRCSTGDMSACEAACDKGLTGEGGCFQAGNLHRERGALDYAGSDLKKAQTYFKRSCDGGYGEGCLFAAQAIEAPYGPIDSDAAGSDPPKTISDDELSRRQSLLERACDLAPAVACKRLGDISIGKNASQAESAYHRACQSSREPAACMAQRSKEVQTLEQWRSACTRGVADACTHLGDALYAIDAPRAVRLFVNECKLRGVETIAGGLGRFVADRARSARGGRMGPPVALGGPNPNAPSVVLASSEVNGGVALVAVRRAVQVHQDQLAACASGLPKGTSAKLRTELVVDATGDAWRATPLETDLPGGSVQCMLSVLEDLAFDGPLSAPAKVELTLSIGGGDQPPRRRP